MSDEIKVGDRFPRQIKVGDRVTHGRDAAHYEVVGTHRDRAHLFYEPQDYHRIVYLSELALAPSDKD